jgi:hypothetical protein
VKINGSLNGTFVARLTVISTAIRDSLPHLT